MPDPSPNYTSPTPGTPAYAQWRVNKAYEDYLGRPATETELNQQLGNGTLYRQNNIDWAVNSVRNSEESRARGNTPPPSTTFNPGSGAGGVPPPTTPTPPGTTPPAEPPMSDLAFGTTPYTDRGSGAGAEGWQYGGFDFAQDPNNRLIGKSAKYTMAEATRLAKAAGATDSWKTKEGAADFAKQWIQPFLEQHGFEVLEIVGDKMKVRDYEARAAGRDGGWVDWVANAGGANPNIAWQTEPTQEAFGPTETYRPQGFMPTTPTPASGTQPVGPPQALGPDQWGRQPGDPQYGRPPAYLADPMSDLAYQELI